MAYLGIEADRRIYYEHYPAGSLTMVLVHGWGMGCRVWDGTLARLQDAGIGVVVYDQRGCGRSDKDFQDVSVAALADDLVALCTHLELDAPILNGWSLGGAEVIEAAARLGAAPRGVGAVVLTCGATPRHVSAPDFPFGPTAADIVATVAALRADRVNFLKGLYFDGVFARDPGVDVKHWCWQIALAAGPAADASLGALATLDQRALLPRITVPALVVVGGQDGVVAPDIGRYAAAHLPAGELVELSDCGHAPFLEDPDTYHRALFGFIDRVRAGRS